MLTCSSGSSGEHRRLRKREWDQRQREPEQSVAERIGRHHEDDEPSDER